MPQPRLHCTKNRPVSAGQIVAAAFYEDKDRRNIAAQILPRPFAQISVKGRCAAGKTGSVSFPI
jgi:hypothetical protein